MTVLIDGIFRDLYAERVYLRYEYTYMDGNKEDVAVLRRVVFSHIQKVISNHSLNTIFPIGTGNEGIDFENHLFNVGLILTGQKSEDPDGLWNSDGKILDISLTKGIISRYAMPDRMVKYKGMDDLLLYEEFNWDTVMGTVSYD